MVLVRDLFPPFPSREARVKRWMRLFFGRSGTAREIHRDPFGRLTVTMTAAARDALHNRPVPGCLKGSSNLRSTGWAAANMGASVSRFSPDATAQSVEKMVGATGLEPVTSCV